MNAHPSMTLPAHTRTHTRTPKSPSLLRDLSVRVGVRVSAISVFQHALQAEVLQGLQPRLLSFHRPLCCLLFLLQLTSHAGSSAPQRAAEENPTPKESTPDKTHTVDLGGDVRLDMVWCPAGSYTCGSVASEAGRDRDEMQRQATLTKGFWMGKYEVTQAQWEAVMGTTPSHFKNAGQHAPVENVSWDDCQAFIRKVNDIVPGGGFRLPSEMEWEYACRAGTTTAFHYGNDLDATMANFDGNFPYGNGRMGEYRRKTMPVGSFLPNTWGLYDMHGNVWEWCSDWHDYYPMGRRIDYTGRTSGSARVDRGGSWYSGARGCRSANRDANEPSFRSNSLGLRLARTYSAAPPVLRDGAVSAAEPLRSLPSPPGQTLDVRVNAAGDLYVRTATNALWVAPFHCPFSPNYQPVCSNLFVETSATSGLFLSASVFTGGRSDLTVAIRSLDGSLPGFLDQGMNMRQSAISVLLSALSPMREFGGSENQEIRKPRQRSLPDFLISRLHGLRQRHAECIYFPVPDILRIQPLETATRARMSKNVRDLDAFALTMMLAATASMRNHKR